jgi:hypothetical protein
MKRYLTASLSSAIITFTILSSQVSHLSATIQIPAPQGHKQACWLRIQKSPPKSTGKNPDTQACPLELFCERNLTAQVPPYGVPFQKHPSNKDSLLPVCFPVTQSMSLKGCNKDWFTETLYAKGETADVSTSAIPNVGIFCQTADREVNGYDIDYSLRQNWFCELLNWPKVFDFHSICGTYTAPTA